MVNDTVPDRVCRPLTTFLARRGVSLPPAQGAGFLRASFLYFWIVLLFTGCASVPTEYPRTTSTAFPDYLDTHVGQLFEAVAVQHPGKSGFGLIRHGHEAFTARIALTELAEKSLDVQYYIWEADETGRILAERLVQAADRGVRVRILVDDINLSGHDNMVAALDAHPNIEIRIFNPFANRNARFFDFALDLDRINHRMHNKVVVVDNALAIVGGRNIGNHYFGVAADANFRDLDIAAAGPVVREISSVFDHFWNGEWAVPISALVDKPYNADDLKAARERLVELIAAGEFPYALDQDVAELNRDLERIRYQFIWAPGQVVWNDPAAIAGGIARGKMVKALMNKLQTLKKELMIESAYFVPRESGIEELKRLQQRGIRVRILTNSLASNDVVAAHAGHAKYRKQLLENGVELYEMRPDARYIRKRVISSRSRGGLHTKALVFDRESVFIGSFNLDPRSASINTEAGLYVESPELAEQVVAYMNEGTRMPNSYRVVLDENGKLAWVTVVDGIEMRFDKDPETTFGQRFMSGFIMLLPVEHQL